MTGSSDALLVLRFRRAMLLLAAAAAMGTAVELAMLRHWDGLEQLVPWATLAAVAVGIVVVAAGQTRAATLVGRTIGIAAGAASLLGVYEHIAANFRSGPLDFRYTDRWPTMSEWSRWWAAATGAVGPSPALAPAILALAGACLAFATLGRTTARRINTGYDEPEPPSEVSRSNHRAPVTLPAFQTTGLRPRG